MRTPEEKKSAQSIAHKKWRESEKGKAYFARNKLKKKLREAGVDVVNIEAEEVRIEDGFYRGPSVK